MKIMVKQETHKVDSEKLPNGHYTQTASEALKEFCRVHFPLYATNVQLLWMLGHKQIEGNKNANQIAKRGLLHPSIRPEPTYDIFDRVAGQVNSNWTCREHQDYWQSIPGQRHSKSCLSKLSANPTVGLLKLIRFQTRHVNGTLSLKGPPLQTWYI
jgi:hypothetical protein